MKNKTYRNILGFFLAATVLIASCKKEDPIKLEPKIATWEIANVTSTAADVSGFVIAEGDGFTEQGIVWSISEQPTISDGNALVDTVKGAVYTAQATGLEFLTTYYVRAYAKSASGTILYGEDNTFTTLANIPFVNVDAVTEILANTATSGGVVTDDGRAAVTAKGVCWGMEENPTIENDSTLDGTGNDAFTSALTGLIGAQTYYVRAYATNEIGTGYSEQVSFTALAGVPVVSTVSVTDVTKFTVKANGNALFTGGQDITERGFCWSFAENPTIADNNIASGNGLGEYMADIAGLESGKEYHIRAYVTNSIGTAYGEDLTFTTIPDEYFLVGSVNGWDNHGMYLANLGNDVHVAYQYLTSADEFKIFPQRDSWDNGWGRGATPGTLVDGGGNIKTSDEPTFTGDGFYELRFDLANGTVALTPVTMGVIGSAQQPGDWTTDTDLTYNQTTKKWEGQVTFEATGEYKFRANNGWDINLGGALDNLVHNGGNIATPGAGTWNVSLDLSGVDGFSAIVSQYPVQAFLVGSINGWDNHGLYLADLGSEVHVGYQYLDDGSEFKAFPQRDSWDNGWGRDGANVGTLVSGGGNILAVDEPTYTGAGFYEIKFDFANGTVTLTPVAMGVIGDAQAGGWGTDVNLTYNQTTKKWEGQVDFLATGEYKFRANDGWDINFGGDLTNLVNGGGNFATPGAGTYTISLDLGGVDNFSATVVVK